MFDNVVVDLIKSQFVFTFITKWCLSIAKSNEKSYNKVVDNFYEILKIKPNATEREIKLAFIGLVSKYHPDIYDGDKDFAQKYTAMLTEAYSTLKDPEKRRDYDLRLNAKDEKRPQKTPSGENYNQVMSKKYFKNAERKVQNNGFFRKLFRSKLFYCLLFIFGIEVLIILLLYV